MERQRWQGSLRCSAGGGGGTPGTRVVRGLCDRPVRLVAQVERDPVRPAGSGAGQGVGGARLAGPAVDAVEDQDRDRPKLPQSYTLQGVRKLLIGNGFSCQVPVRRAVERDEEQTRGWVKETSPQVETSRRRSMRGSSSRTSPASR
ncbi:winged helix-turn-helix domain-containing protein [Streptomyces chartreusis]|uniref:helix-turn-helix domain-containing protein n=1 Tax=Streptomyces chartreusis TaxID=1969 RepID=UPI003658ECBC